MSTLPDNDKTRHIDQVLTGLVKTAKTNSITNTIQVGSAPTLLAYNPSNNNVYVGNGESNTVSVISTTASQQMPPETAITSAIDGNGVTVQNDATTTSSSIKIAFTATQGSNPIADSQCSLDHSPFSSCSSPAVFNNLAAGPHKFVVVAVDNAGNRDPSPATFGWTVGTLSPIQSIQQLIQLKHNMHLNPTTDRTLDIRLNIALQFAQNNIKSGTCVQLSVFIKLVQAELRLGQVSSAQAIELIQGAQNIQTVLGCTSGNGIVASSLSASQTPSSNNNNLTHRQQPQTTTSSPSLLQPQSQSHYPYSNQYRYPSQNPQSQSPQNQLLPPVANAGISQTVNENTKVTLDGRASYSPTGGIVVAYQWTQSPNGIPITLTGVNTATPTFTAPVVPIDTILAFSLRVVDNHGAVITNPAVVYVMVKQNPNVISNSGATGGITPNAISPPSQLKSFPQKGSPTSQNTFPSRVQ